MALGFFFSPPTMTAEQYDECIKRLEKAGAGKPVGRQYHCCLRNGNKMQVFDVWESQAAFDKFGETLLPILKQIGAESGQPQVTPVHNIIKG